MKNGKYSKPLLNKFPERTKLSYQKYIKTAKRLKIQIQHSVHYKQQYPKTTQCGFRRNVSTIIIRQILEKKWEYNS